MTGSLADPGPSEPALSEDGGGECVSVSLGLLLCLVVPSMSAAHSPLRGDRLVGSIFGFIFYGGGFSCRSLYAVL